MSIVKLSNKGSNELTNVARGSFNTALYWFSMFEQIIIFNLIEPQFPHLQNGDAFARNHNWDNFEAGFSTLWVFNAQL